MITDFEFFQKFNSIPRTVAFVNFISKNKEFKTKFLSITKFLDEKYDEILNSQRYWHIKNQNYSLIKCKYCYNNLAKWDYSRSQYSSCSIECKNNLTSEASKNNKDYFHSEEFKKKCIATSMKKFGVEHYSKTEEFQTRIQKTMFELYGVTNAGKSEELKEKAKNTSIKKYGFEHPSKNDKIKEKIQKTQIKKYGMSFSKTEEYLEKCKFYWIKEFENNLNEEYSLVDYGETLKLKHNVCNSEFFLNRFTYNSRIIKNLKVCPVCNPLQKNYSFAEKEIVSFIKETYSNTVKENDRNTITPLELDIFLPELNLAIEYNSLYWHSENFVGKNFHKIKTNLCKEKNIQLIHIYEDDWKYKKEIIIGIIKNYLGFSEKIFARKTEIKKILVSEERNFLNENHLQGYSASTVCYGLYYNDELIQMMSFKKLGVNWELFRLGIKQNTSIVGGSKKLFKKFIKEFNPIEITTYCDEGVFSGKTYTNLGFEKLSTTKPSFSYFDKKTNIRINRRSLQKQKLLLKNPEMINMTGDKIAENLGYLKIYNSGIGVYKWNNVSGEKL